MENEIQNGNWNSAIIYPEDKTKKTNTRRFLYKNRINFNRVTAIADVPADLVSELQNMGNQVITLHNGTVQPASDTLKWLWTLMNTKMVWKKDEKGNPIFTGADAQMLKKIKAIVEGNLNGTL